MKQEDEKLRVCLRKAIAMDDIRLDEEMKNSEPHEFSPEFEQKMEDTMKVARKKKNSLARFKQLGAISLF